MLLKLIQNRRAPVLKTVGRYYVMSKKLRDVTVKLARVAKRWSNNFVTIDDVEDESIHKCHKLTANLQG